MNILLVVPYYPHAGHPFSGAFNEMTAITLKELCRSVEVLAPRPYIPPLLSSLTPRWRAYEQIRTRQVRNGVTVNRPACCQLPRVGSAFWCDKGAFLSCRRTAREIHKRVGLDAIISFDLYGAGGLAWRLGKDLGIPACGWGTGSDLAQPPKSTRERVVLRALERLDLVFYQSRELFEVASRLLGKQPFEMSQGKHSVLARGVIEPPSLPKRETRRRVREAWGMHDDQVIVLNIGRVVRQKGVFELLEAISIANRKNARISCVIVGSHAGFDETSALQKKLDETPRLRERVKLLPACRPDQVWEYLCAADVFAFPSHQRFEGMPNSLLEAMVMGVPAVAFASRPVLEIEAGTGALLHVPTFHTELFAESILHLAASPGDRVRRGENGRRLVLDRFMLRKNMAQALQWLAQKVDSQPSEHFRECELSREVPKHPSKLEASST